MAKAKKAKKEKLIRDKIPKIIRAKGEKCKTRVEKNLGKRLALLWNKLDEESEEYLNAPPQKILEELADMHEVIYGLAHLHGFSRHQLAQAVKKKYKARGGFKHGIVLIREE